MARKKDPESVVVDFFATAELDKAQTVLNICKSLVANRQRTASQPRTASSDATAPTDRLTLADDTVPV